VIRLRALIIWGLLSLTSGALLGADKASIVKVLPHLLDLQGKASLAPGLFQRDAYQGQLRKDPKRVSGMRFNVQWKAKGIPADELMLKVWLKTSGRSPNDPLQLTAPIRGNRKLGRWSSVYYDGKLFTDNGQVLAWKVELLHGETSLATQTSFLW
jgi:hypothetical protein